MSNIRCTTLRFNLDKPLDRAAWEHMQAMDREIFKSYSQAVVLAVTEFFKRYNRKNDDPYFETREREEQFVEQIVSAVERALEKALPGFLASCFSKMVMPYNVVPGAVGITNTGENNTSAEDIDMDFVGG